MRGQLGEALNSHSDENSSFPADSTVNKEGLRNIIPKIIIILII